MSETSQFYCDPMQSPSGFGKKHVFRRQKATVLLCGWFDFLEAHEVVVQSSCGVNARDCFLFRQIGLEIVDARQQLKYPSEPFGVQGHSFPFSAVAYIITPLFNRGSPNSLQGAKNGSSGGAVAAQWHEQLSGSIRRSINCFQSQTGG